VPKRCGCADNCACLITAGAGVAVGGLGTIEDPYVIEADVTPIPESVTYRASATVEWRTAGAGTPDSPMDVYADAKVGMRELTDVLASDVPITGDVVTWQADHWEFRPAGALPPGGTTNQVLAKKSATDGDAQWITIAPGGGSTVNTGGGVGGDGSVGTPVVLRNSGSWPLLNYPADMSGLLGREVFVDSSGQVRAKPDVIFSSTGKVASALIGTYPVGVTVMSVTAAQGSGWPPNGSCTVITARRADGTAGVQWCCLDSASVSVGWYRQGGSAGWSPWVPLADPAVPAPLYAEVSGDIDVTTTSSGVELPTKCRATIVNPHPYRRLLCHADLQSWNVMGSTTSAGGSACYAGPIVVSGGGTWAVVQTDWRSEVDAKDSLYISMNLPNYLWVPAAATVVVGFCARRTNTTVPYTVRTPRTEIIPIRYE
jgi:hypothetical protein